MSTPSVKFCGLTRPEDIATAISLGANMLGFIIECESPRSVDVNAVAQLTNPLRGLVPRVAVTVNPDNGLITRLNREMKPDYIQLHGDEAPARVKEIQTLSNAGIIKAISVATHTDLERAKAYEELVDYILLDAKPPKGSAQRGGHGKSFDWTLLDGFSVKSGLILAGGLSPSSIGRAKNYIMPNLFDVSSGVVVAAGASFCARLFGFGVAVPKMDGI